MTRSVTKLDPSRQSEESQLIENEITSEVIGQNQAIRKIVQVVQTYNTGLNKSGSTISNILLLGSSGVGKTKAVSTLAKVLLGDEKSMLKIDCGEFQMNQDIAKIVGAPPGYTGHRDTAHLITQQKLDQYQTENCKVNIILFDEIEKAADSMQKLLLGILDKATLRTSHNTDIDFSKTIVFMTSNLGSSEARDLINNKLGFVNTDVRANIDEKMAKINTKAVEKHFLTELVGRIDHMINFNNLTREDMRNILRLELSLVQKKIFSTNNIFKFTFYWDKSVEEFLLDDGFSSKYGARNIAKSVKTHITDKLANLVASRQIYLGDVIKIITHNNAVKFIRIPADDIRDLPDDKTWDEYKHDLENINIEEISN